MLNNLEDIKSLVLWAKDNKIAQVGLGSMTFTFHDTAFATKLEKKEFTELDIEQIEKLKKQQEEELLYFSAK